MKTKITILLAGFLSFCSLQVIAKVELPCLLSNGMIVQKNEPVKLWGKADVGEKINAKASNSPKTYTTEAGTDGKWEIIMDSLPVGGPYEIMVNDIKIEDVLSGYVFLCSGQSNMALPVKRVMDMFEDEIISYGNNSIRQFLVPQVTSFHGKLENTSPSEWKPCEGENVMNFSALAYFFAKELNSKTGVPVGIINASWGGTPIESWISESTMNRWPENIRKKKIYEDDGYRERSKKLEGENYYRWNKELDENDPGLTSEKKWYEEYIGDGNWEQTDLINDHWGLDNSHETATPVNGSHWLRKTISLTKQQAQGEATLRLGCIEGADSAYVNGKFVGTIGYQYPPRIYKVPSGTLHEGENTFTIRVISQGGEPKVVPEKPYKLLTSNGDQISLEGKWKHHVGARMPKGPDMIFWHYTPIVLYDAMISPLFNYPVAGVVWYQGESNISNRELYAEMLTAMINDWRKGYTDENVPFYIVELADFLHPSDIGGRKAWQEMREQQARAASSDVNATLIKNSDLGEWNDIHPLDKKTLGIRVADAVVSSK